MWIISNEAEEVKTLIKYFSSVSGNKSSDKQIFFFFYLAESKKKKAAINYIKMFLKSMHELTCMEDLS